MDLTEKGRPRDGYYYPINCSIHGRTEGACLGKKLICLKCEGKKTGKIELDRSQEAE